MKTLFSEVLTRIERFFTTGNQDLTADEKSVLRTVLTDFKDSINSGHLDRFTDRKNPVTYEVFSLEIYNDHVMYLKGIGNGYEIKRLKYKTGDLNFERLKRELEKIGFKVQMSRYSNQKQENHPMHVFFTVPTKKVDP